MRAALLLALLAHASQGAGRLASEPSPYLRAHAADKVDWRPWGPEAFAQARRRNKPVFLSIGYLACHWCHQMQAESFSDPAIAGLLNKSFVPVLVDREELPAVDQLYSTAVRGMTGVSGWPLNVWLTPELSPFFGGTYFPPRSDGEQPGLLPVLQGIAKDWKDDRAQLLKTGAEVSRRLAESMRVSGSSRPAAALADAAFRAHEAAFDAANGGFGSAPKFPSPASIELLLRRHARTGEPRAREMALLTLRKMAAGELRDPEGGWRRYAAGADWSRPHLEKMLYDQALLAAVYLDAGRAFGAPELTEEGEETLDFVLRELRAPGGAFYASKAAYADTRDEKVLPGWNGLMLSALARSGRADRLEAARKAADALRPAKELRRMGRPAAPEDYALLAQGLLDLYEAGGRLADLKWALELTRTQDRLFFSEGVLYSTGTALPVRVLEVRDAEVPSATSAAALNRLRLALYAGRDAGAERSERTLAALSSRLRDDPRGLAKLACAAEFAASKPLRVVVTEGEGAEALLAEVRGRYLPSKALLVLDAEGRKAFVERFAFLRGAVPVKGRAAAYVCLRQTCELPATRPEDLAALLESATIPATPR